LEYNLLKYGEDGEYHFSWVPTGLRIGARFVLVECDDISPNNIHKPAKWSLHKGPVGGNSDPAIKRFHGWRGTTNDIHVSAHGERIVQKIRNLKNGDIAVTVGPDVRSDEK